MNRWIQLICVVVAAACLVGVACLRPRIDRDRRDLQLTIQWQDKEQSYPPSIVLAKSLGTFRGFLVSALWYRAHVLKESGRFYEANHLSQWITNLQPRFPMVWSFHAWNMAYNISVATHTADERWYWVQSGIRLLRDKGIPLNPTTPRLYKELGWIFHHKIGQTSDDMHWYYKRKLAEQWQTLQGAPLDRVQSDDAVDQMRQIAQAADTLSGFLADHPQAGPLWEYLESLGYKPDGDLLRQIGSILMYNYSPDRALWSQLQIRIPDQFDSRLDRIFTDSQMGPGVELLLAFLRKRTLIREYHMDPQVMVQVMEEFGPLDWRHPDAHGLYWNHMGIQAALQLPATDEVNVLNIYRSRIHAIQALAHWGRVSFDPNIPGPPTLLPDERFVEKYDVALAAVKKYLDAQEGKQGVYESFEAGHENFLLKHLVTLYFTGGYDKAQELYARLRREYGHKRHNQAKYMLPLEELVMREYAETADMQVAAIAMIRDMIYRGIYQGLGTNEVQWFEHSLRLARDVHDRYMKDKPINPGTIRDRMTLPPFDQMVADFYLEYMSEPRYPLQLRARIWRNTPLALQGRVYETLYVRMAPQAQVAGLDPHRVLPPPEGMAALRPDFDALMKQQMEGTGTVQRQ